MEKFIERSRLPEMCEIIDTTEKPDDTTYHGDGRLIDWYLYPDPVHAGLKSIAVNISWGPTNNGLVTHLQGFEVVFSNGKAAYPPLYYCLHTKLDFFKHALSDFHYDCFGLINQTYVNPGDQIDILVRSLPRSQTNEKKFRIEIPCCKKRKKFSEVSYCSLKKFINATAKVVSCNDRLVQFTYVVPDIYRNKFHIQSLVSNPAYKTVSVYNTSQLAGNITFTLPEKCNFSQIFAVAIVESSRCRERLSLTTFNFTECQNAADVTTFFTIGLVGTIFVIIAAAIVVVVISDKRHHVSIWLSLKCDRDSKFGGGVMESVSQQRQDETEQSDVKAGMKDKVQKLFVVFCDDHDQHRCVILKLINFLVEDLGFQVSSELSESLNLIEDAFSWMDQKLSEADKVVVIWSPLGKEKWQKYMECSVIDSNSPDVFSPVVKQIRNDLRCGRNLGKYIFAYFEYCSTDVIPDIFAELAVPCFRLMNQLEDIYFKITGEEKYNPGGTLRVENVESERYFLHGINRHGLGLKTRVDEMCKFVRIHPKWFERKISVEPSCLVSSCVNHDYIQTNSIHVVPPPIVNNVQKTAFINNDETTSLLDNGCIKEVQVQSVNHQITTVPRNKPALEKSENLCSISTPSSITPYTHTWEDHGNVSPPYQPMPGQSHDMAPCLEQDIKDDNIIINSVEKMINQDSGCYKDYRDNNVNDAVASSHDLSEQHASDKQLGNNNVLDSGICSYKPHFSNATFHNERDALLNNDQSYDGVIPEVANLAPLVVSEDPMKLLMSINLQSTCGGIN
ncbi:unnamed protein product [Clavelina lepadiformis]|uniref:SEFIR domain-containing protein n=1 Tax=Clavelina lepadiformis TaxID=159417 RepID=A0ABP0H6B3_CLALP